MLSVSMDDVLWDDLTAMDHMLLVSAFKGMELLLHYPYSPMNHPKRR